MKHQKNCDVNSNIGIPKIQKDESYCTCGITISSINPLVEKLVDWNPPIKEDRSEIEKLYANAIMNVIRFEIKSFVNNLSLELDENIKAAAQNVLEHENPRNKGYYDGLGAGYKDIKEKLKYVKN